MEDATAKSSSEVAREMEQRVLWNKTLFPAKNKVVKEENSSGVNSNTQSRSESFAVLIACNKFYKKKWEPTKTESITTC